jgi:glycosyltransferase involved in cell wall biosynthesis
MRRHHVLTWHVHGSYLYYLAHAHQEFYLPVNPARSEGYFGRTPSYPWPANVHEVPAGEVRHLPLDCLLFQSRQNYLHDQYEILSESQRRLPRVYLEHDPPREHPTDTRHVVDDPDVLLVHVTDFNDLMWDAGPTTTRIIDHGVTVPPGVRYRGELERGIVIVNNLRKRGRRLGADVFARIRETIPLDLVGMGWRECGGLDEVPHHLLPAFQAGYRFFFNPIRYTSLGLAVCEAMMIGMPILGLATTEMVTVVQNGVSGFVETNVDRLIAHMQRLIAEPEEAHHLSVGARTYAQERFNIHRFVRDWDDAFALVAGSSADVLVSSPGLPEPVGGAV